MAVICRDRSVRLVDTSTLQVVIHFRPGAGVGGVAFDADGQHLAIGCRDGSLSVWECATGARRWYREGHRGPVRCLAISRHGCLASGDEQGQIRLWDTGSGRAAGSLNDHTGAIEAVAFTPDGATLASCGQDGTVRLWDPETRTMRGQPLRHGSPVSGLAISPTGSLLATTEVSGPVRLWRLPDATGIVRLSGHLAGEPGFVSFSADGSMLAEGERGTVRFWDVEARHRRHVLEAHDRPIYGVAFSSFRRVLATTGRDGAVKLWDTQDWWLAKPMGLPPPPVHSLAFAEGGQVLVVGGAEPTARVTNYPVSGIAGYNHQPIKKSCEDSIGVWDVASATQQGLITGHDTLSIDCLALSPDGRMVTSGTTGGMVWTSDLRQGQNRLAFYVSADAQRYHGLVTYGTAISAGLNNIIPILSNITPISPKYAENVRVNVRALAFAPDGQTLAVALDDGTIQLRQTGTWNLRSILSKHDGLTVLTFSPDGKWLAANHGDQIRLWDVATGQLKAEPDGGRRHPQIRCLAFSAGGTRMATGGGDRLVRLWDPEPGTKPRILRGHTDGVASLTFSPDGRTLATGGLAGMVRLWDLTLYQELVTLEGHTGAVACLSFVSDGTVLASGGTSSDGTGEVFLWRAQAVPNPGPAE